MKFRLNIWFMVCCVMAVLSGCTLHESAKVSAAVDQDFVNAYEAFEMAKIEVV